MPQTLALANGSSLGLVLWACLLALGWLLPNHYQPWLAFHADAWVAIVMVLAMWTTLWRRGDSWACHSITVVLALLVCLPGLQYAGGLISQPGVAWIHSMYLLGLLLAVMVGARWEAIHPNQPGDALFLAIVIAATFSVGLQLQQWLGQDEWVLLNMGGGLNRPHANLGQPNQLATLLLWGVLGAAWGWQRKQLSGRTAFLLASFLLFGVALTASRTAWIGVLLLFVAGWCWRRLWSDESARWWIVALALLFCACVAVQGPLREFLSTDAFAGFKTPLERAGAAVELRPIAWAALSDALWQKPWVGYGWGQIAMAQMAVATRHPHIEGIFSYAHNLVLDLVLWCGIPIGTLVCVALAWWIWTHLRNVRRIEDAILCMFLMVVGNHAMFELPLASGYFLFPVGLVVGMLNAKLRARVVMQLPRRAVAAIASITTALLGIILYDYSKVETSYEILRMEMGHMKITVPKVPPNVLLLTQWYDYVLYSRLTPMHGMSAETLARLQTVAVLKPNPRLFLILAVSLALNQRPNEARLWLLRMCKSMPEENCLQVREEWARQAKIFPEVAAIAWPNM